MSRENVEIVRRVFEAVARRDTEAVLGLYDPNLVWDHTHGPARGVLGETVYRGHEGLRAWSREWYDAWETVDAVVDDLIEAGDKVLSMVTYRGRGQASGIEVEWPQMAGIWTIHDGKVVEVAWFTSREEALDAAGVRE